MRLKRQTNDDSNEKPGDMIKFSSTWLQDDLCTCKFDFTDTSRPSSSGGLYLQNQHFLGIAVKFLFPRMLHMFQKSCRSLELRKLRRLDCNTMAVLEVCKKRVLFLAWCVIVFLNSRPKVYQKTINTKYEQISTLKILKGAVALF